MYLCDACFYDPICKYNYNGNFRHGDCDLIGKVASYSCCVITSVSTANNGIKAVCPFGPKIFSLKIVVVKAVSAQSRVPLTQQR